MKRLLPLLVLAACLALIAMPMAAVLAQGPNFPEYQGFVNDYAGLLSPAVKTQLDVTLTQLEKDTTAEVAVVTVKSLEGDSVDDYAVRLFEKWKIGKKGKDNGVLFLVAVDERKMRIEVGYGLEPLITDGRAGRIRDNDVIPKFKNNDYEGGITAGVASIEKYIRDGTPPAPLEENPVKSALGDWTGVLFFLTIITVYLSGFMARSKSIWMGGIWGAVAGIILGLVIGGIAALVAAPLIFAGLGLLTDFILSRNYQKLQESGKATDWHKTGGGFWGPGGFGGGSGGGGGFGGFGGGGSGGGGAGGGW
ncbi:MAG: TPM domain-containing protein [Chloroflexi bacterium]|nr:TPM domain-containing protein [Chloroflexota bacterium]